jgi:coenzyme F420-reducing hydrogenase delta subunit
MELNKETIIKQMQEWSDAICENACLKGECINGRVIACEICFPNTVRNALALIKELTEENERLRASSIDYRNIPDIIAEAKADTVKEFAERLTAEFRKDGRMNYYIRMTLDQIKKEMLKEE